MITDPVADVLTKIRNGSRRRLPAVDVVASKLTERMLMVFKQEGFIRNYKAIGQAPRKRIRIYLKYAPDKTPAIRQVTRVSTPGRRRYRGVDDMPRVLGGLGRAIVTTSRGLMTDRQARDQRVGGEVLCYVW